MPSNCNISRCVNAYSVYNLHCHDNSGDQQPSFTKSISSDLLVLVPSTPIPDVCAVYDMVNGTLQIIESKWNEVVCRISQKCWF